MLRALAGLRLVLANACEGRLRATGSSENRESLDDKVSNAG
jgi:hypothetical protein